MTPAAVSCALEKQLAAVDDYQSGVLTMTRIFFLMAVVLAAQAVSAAQLYRWVDDKGRVEWRDTPPPANAKKVERRTIEASVIETSALPYSVQQAVRNFPVTLYTSNCGEGCDKARAHLVRRGVPFTQKNPQDDIDGYRKLTNGGMEVPLLYIGREQMKGYLETGWDSALDNAGYPRQPVPGYVAPKPPAAPLAAKPAPAAPQGEPPQAAVPAPAPAQ